MAHFILALADLPYPWRHSQQMSYLAILCLYLGNKFSLTFSQTGRLRDDSGLLAIMTSRGRFSIYYRSFTSVTHTLYLN